MSCPEPKLWNRSDDPPSKLVVGKRTRLELTENETLKTKTVKDLMREPVHKIGRTLNPHVSGEELEWRFTLLGPKGGGSRVDCVWFREPEPGVVLSRVVYPRFRNRPAVVEKILRQLDPGSVMCTSIDVGAPGADNLPEGSSTGSRDYRRRYQNGDGSHLGTKGLHPPRFPLSFPFHLNPSPI